MSCISGTFEHLILVNVLALDSSMISDLLKIQEYDGCKYSIVYIRAGKYVCKTTDCDDSVDSILADHENNPSLVVFKVNGSLSSCMRILSDLHYSNLEMELSQVEEMDVIDDNLYMIGSAK